MTLNQYVCLIIYKNDMVELNDEKVRFKKSGGIYAPKFHSPR